MNFTFNNEQDLINFFHFCTLPHWNMRYWVRNSLLYFSLNNPIEAGVLVGFYFRKSTQEYEIVFTQRSAQLKHHSNQISFPGGKRELEDQTILQTATRETEEEIGICREHIRTYGVLKKIKSPANYEVYPVLGIIDECPKDQNKNTDEVKETFTVPCQILLDPKHYSFKTYSTSKVPIKMVYIDYHDKHIWGLTAEILYFLAKSYLKYRR
ncbi:NUDIX domain-containing protein [Neisseriaceae bacterium PsAf]|nr:NUDIX domain-containing protein [Neisseriaceae bacterium PsAf]MCV2503460.1 CoA pyrophosphatase [Neisseriaceae bacterium]